MGVAKLKITPRHNNQPLGPRGRQSFRERRSRTAKQRTKCRTRAGTSSETKNTDASLCVRGTQGRAGVCCRGQTRTRGTASGTHRRGRGRRGGRGRSGHGRARGNALRGDGTWGTGGWLVELAAAAAAAGTRSRVGGVNTTALPTTTTTTTTNSNNINNISNNDNIPRQWPCGSTDSLGGRQW